MIRPFARRPSSCLRVTELERRDTPAWWSVTPPTLAEGTVGDTAASHTGQIEFSPAYVPEDGQVAVFADTAAEAAGMALFGTISVTAGGQTTDYTFGPDTVGVSAADQKPFLVTTAGGTVSIASEDMAGLAGCDYDYNDRSWGGATGGAVGASVVDTGSWTHFLNDDLSQTATINYRVTRHDPATFLWQYELVNNSVSSNGNGAEGLNVFILNDLPVGVTFDHTVTSTSGWWHVEDFSPRALYWGGGGAGRG